MRRILLLLIPLLAVSCQYDRAEWAPIVKLAVNHAEVVLPGTAPADSGVFVYSNRPYEVSVESGSEWLEVTLAESDSLAFRVTGNNGFRRSSRIRLRSGDREYALTVKQPGVYAEYINFSRASITVTGEGGSFQVGVQTNLLDRDLNVDVSGAESVRDISLNQNLLSFTVAPSRHLETRTYTVTVWAADGWGDIVKKDLKIIQEPVSKRKIKVLYHNIFLRKYGTEESTLWTYRKPGIVKMLSETEPDVFGLNECDWQQRCDLASAFPGYSVVGVCTDGTTIGYKNASNPVFYKTTVFTCEQWGTFWLSDTPDEASYTWEPLDGEALNQRRNCTWARLYHRRTGQTVLFAVTHLANDEAGARSRKLSIQLLADRLAALAPDIPVILGGDFNSSLSGEDARPLRECMLEARNSCAEADKGMTYNAFSVPSGKSILDHIFYSGLEGDVFTVDRNPYEDITYISDHFPVWAAFRLPED